MITYSTNSRLNMNEYIAGHLYKDSKGVCFIFLGQGIFKSNRNFMNTSNSSYFLILTLKGIKELIKSVYSFDDLINFLKDNNIDLFEYLYMNAGPRPAIEDLGEIFDCEDLLRVYEYTYKYTASDGTITDCNVSIDFRENMEGLKEG